MLRRRPARMVVVSLGAGGGMASISRSSLSEEEHDDTAALATTTAGLWNSKISCAGGIDNLLPLVPFPVCNNNDDDDDNTSIASDDLTGIGGCSSGCVVVFGSVMHSSSPLTGASGS